VDSIEFSQMEMKVFTGLKQGNEALKEIHNEMSIEAVEQLMSDTQDAIDYQNVCDGVCFVVCNMFECKIYVVDLFIQEIDELMSGKLTEEDNEAILAELEELEKEVCSHKHEHKHNNHITLFAVTCAS
jgi:charged multivesicular body protein 6